MDDQVLLYDSITCRLCAEENENGIPLYVTEENEPDLSATVNRYLPLKVRDDGKFPRTICPGCNIQLDGMVQFMELVIAGQEKLRELWRQQSQNRRRKEKEKLLSQDLFSPDADTDVSGFMIQAFEEDGKEILIQIMPDGSLFSPEHEMTLKVEGLEKPKRKRGRPPKPPPSEIEPEQPQLKRVSPEPAEEEVEDEGDGRKRRKRKVPTRFLEAVQGKELERMFREEGVIDEEDKSEGSTDDREERRSGDEGGEEIIGRTEGGVGGSELVIVSKMRSRRSKAGRRRKTYPCEICGRSFLHHGRYVMHKSFHKNVKFECLNCKQTYDNREDLANHQTESGHTGEGIVETVDPDDDEDNNDENNAAAAGKLKCEKCDKRFMSKQSYEVHLKAVHEGKKPYACGVCDRTFAYQASLRCHLATHGLEVGVGDIAGDGDGDEEDVAGKKTTAQQLQQRGQQKGTFACDSCDKVFNHPSSVVYHKEAEHNNGRRFVCVKCGKSFKHKQLLQRHQLVHSEERPYTCKSCGAAFKTRANLLNHQPTHTGVKKYFCQQCGQLFAHKTSLTLHQRWHSGQKPYSCQVCGKSFSQKGNLQEHSRIHTGEKPYCCDHCGRKFTTSSQFKLHVKRHTGERPWRCDYCAKTFLHKDTWKCHVRRHRNERPFQCDICARGFTEQWALKKHRRLHTGEKPYSCDVCHKAFADCSNLTKHKKVHRPSVAVPSVTAAATAVAVDQQLIYVYKQDVDDMDADATVAVAGEVVNGDVDGDDVDDDAVVAAAAAAAAGVDPEQHHHVYFGADDDDDVDDADDGRHRQTHHRTSHQQHQLQVALDDGTVVPIQLAVETKPEDVADLMDQSVQFISEDGQNVCLVTTSYNIDTDPVAYLPIT